MLKKFSWYGSFLFLTLYVYGCSSTSNKVVLSPEPSSVVSVKEVDENILLFNATSKLIQKIPLSNIISPKDKILIVNVDAEDQRTIDRLKEGGTGIDGVVTLRTDALKAAEDGVIAGFSSIGVV